MPFLKKKRSVFGRMPFWVKTALADYFDGWLYFLETSMVALANARASSLIG
jgi:hypothetical protein